MSALTGPDMSIMQEATLRLLPENETQSAIVPTQIILHTAVDAPGPTRLDRYFARQDVGLESHFWVPLDGTVVQMMDTNVRADANRLANVRAISIETEDEGDPEGVPWTDAQIAAIVSIIKWANKEHGIPMELAPAWNAPGLGWHAMWGAPSPWTPSRGKTCPGSTRITQFTEIVLPLLSEESIMDNATARGFVHDLYALLGRSPDSAGLEFWAGVAQEKGRADAFWAFLAGARPELAREKLRILELERRVATLEARSPMAQTAAVDIDEVIEELVARLEG